MGEIADMMLDGTLCQVCGAYIGDAEGYPRTCIGCREDEEDEQDDTEQEQSHAE
jgi:hypothetical protein